jgi:4-diphosphocytidyl-2-C-methyl-D-erythritol kinase
VAATTGRSKLHLSGKAVAGSLEHNLVWKAYKMLEQRYPESARPVDIYLHKTIPMGAGMGGGSADGAFMLVLLNDYWNLKLAKDELLELALILGSDCPFFIHNTPQYATGRGEVMEPVAIDLSSYSLQIICPQVHIATAKAFEEIKPKPAPMDMKTLASLNVADWKGVVSNDFEKPVFEQHPQLKDIKRQLYNGGAIYASMTGSGSAMYGLLPKGRRALVSAGMAVEDWWIE